MSLNFAPYSSPPSSPRNSKGKAPWFPSAGSSGGSGRQISDEYNSAEAGSTYQSGAPINNLDTSNFSSNNTSNHIGGDHGNEADLYATRFGYRLDLCGCACYILGPVFAFILLIVEVRNDWVRFHGFQSLLLSASVLVLHLIFLWSSFISWLLFIVDVFLFLWLAFNSYRDAEYLRKQKLPYIGEIAERWVNEE